jgi:hypothetical protein
MGLPSGLFTLGFPTKILHAFTSSMRATPTHTSYPLWFGHLNNIWWSVQFMKFLIMQSSPSSHQFPTSSKCCPQHAVLKCPQFMSFLECERPSFIPIQNNR